MSIVDLQNSIVVGCIGVVSPYRDFSAFVNHIGAFHFKKPFSLVYGSDHQSILYRK